MARLALAPFTMTETMRMLQPVGLDRWPQELALKYGIRDHLTCPVGGRWVSLYTGRKKCAVRAALAKGSRPLTYGRNFLCYSSAEDHRSLR